jgi:hypothetical protein
MINNIDLDGNQVVDFNEFLQMMGHNSVNNWYFVNQIILTYLEKKLI